MNPHRWGYLSPFFIQSAVTCLQWPAEYIIVFGLAEGKVRESVGIMVPGAGLWFIFSPEAQVCTSDECLRPNFIVLGFCLCFLVPG